MLSISRIVVFAQLFEIAVNVPHMMFKSLMGLINFRSFFTWILVFVVPKMIAQINSISIYF